MSKSTKIEDTVFEFEGRGRLQQQIAGLFPQGLLLTLPDQSINDLLRGALFPEMASLNGHTIADHAAITERLLGQPYTEVHQYIDAAVKSLGPHHRSVLHDVVFSSGDVAQHFENLPGEEQRVALAANLGHYLPDSTTPDGVRFLGFPVHLSDLLQGMAWVSLAWGLWDAAGIRQRLRRAEGFCRRGRAALLRGDYRQAAELYEVAVFWAKDHPNLYINLGHARRLDGQPTGALAAYLRAADLFGPETVPLRDLEVGGRGLALLFAAVTGEITDEVLLRRAAISFKNSCREAAGGSAKQVQRAALWERTGVSLSRIAPLCGSFIRQAGRIYRPRAAVGNAFMAVLCEKLEREVTGSGID